MADPVAEAFRKIIQEIYWIDDLEEAEERLEEYLSMIDEDLREILLEKRRRLCNDPLAVIELVRLDAAASSINDNETVQKILLVKTMVETGFLLQCTETWSRMGPKEKARILAPLYRASYGLELALKGWPKTIDTAQLDHAFRMATIAMERADEIGLLEEFEEYVERVLRVQEDSTQ